VDKDNQEGNWPNQAAYDSIHAIAAYTAAGERQQALFGALQEAQVYNRYVEVPAGIQHPLLHIGIVLGYTFLRIGEKVSRFLTTHMTDRSTNDTITTMVLKSPSGSRLAGFLLLTDISYPTYRPPVYRHTLPV
jgi:hypothetical protein